MLMIPSQILKKSTGLLGLYLAAITRVIAANYMPQQARKKVDYFACRMRVIVAKYRPKNRPEFLKLTSKSRPEEQAF